MWILKIFLTSSFAVYSRTLVHVDMDMYYAAVEMRDNPHLRQSNQNNNWEGSLSTYMCTLRCGGDVRQSPFPNALRQSNQISGVIEYRSRCETIPISGNQIKIVNEIGHWVHMSRCETIPSQAIKSNQRGHWVHMYTTLRCRFETIPIWGNQIKAINQRGHWVHMSRCDTIPIWGNQIKIIERQGH